MTITRAFVKYMEDVLNVGVLNTDIFIGGVPADLKDKAPDACWWIYANGGTPVSKNSTGEKQKTYILNVYFRDTDAQNVDETMQAFEIAVNGKNCSQLESFDTIEIEAMGFQSDLDLDNQERTVGMVQVTVRVYQSS